MYDYDHIAYYASTALEEEHIRANKSVTWVTLR